MKVGMEQYRHGDKQGTVFIAVLVSLLAQPDYRTSADSTFSLIPFVFSLSLSQQACMCYRRGKSNFKYCRQVKIKRNSPI